VGNPGDRHELLNRFGGAASDDTLVEALLAFANGAEVVLRTGLGGEDWISPPVPEEWRERFCSFLRVVAGRDLSRIDREFDFIFHVLQRLRPVPIYKSVAAGIRLGYFHDFPDPETALSFASLLLLDVEKPYGKALSQCKLPTCNQFYLAKKNPEGGPPNFNYCKPEHRDEAHNSREFRQQMRSARRSSGTAARNTGNRPSQSNSPPSAQRSRARKVQRKPR
jgi:hypothetical protein